MGTPVNLKSVVLGRVLREVGEDFGWSTIRASVESGGEISTSAVGMHERGERQVLLAVFDRLCGVYQVGARHVLAVTQRRLGRSRRAQA